MGSLRLLSLLNKEVNELLNMEVNEQRGLVVSANEKRANRGEVQAVSINTRPPILIFSIEIDFVKKNGVFPLKYSARSVSPSASGASVTYVT